MITLDRFTMNNITVDKDIDIDECITNYVIKTEDTKEQFTLTHDEVLDLCVALKKLLENPKNSLTDFKTFYNIERYIGTGSATDLNNYQWVKQCTSYKECVDIVSEHYDTNKDTFAIVQVTYGYYDDTNSQPIELEDTFKILSLLKGIRIIDLSRK